MKKSRASHRGRVATSLGVALVLTSLLQSPTVAQAPPTPYEIYSGGAYPMVMTSSTWTMQDRISGGMSTGPTITLASLHGTFVGPRVDCTTWRGLSSDSGSLTVGITGKTYTIYDVAVDTNVYSATTQTLAGKWVDTEGVRGVFAGFGYFDYVVGHDCGIYIDQWAFAQSSVDPQDLLDYLEEQVPENQAPQAPTLLAPSDGYTFQPDQLQTFTVQASDPDDDGYVGQIFVRRPAGGPDFDREWATAPARSGEPSSGVPPVPYPADNGYLWKARASDGRLTSPESGTTRTFSVLP